MIGKKKRKVTDGPRARPQPQRIRFPIVTLIRMFALGALAVVAAAWAIWRQYTVPFAPMMVPVHPAPSASEIEVDLEP